MEDLKLHIAHVGINSADEAEALAAAKLLEAIFGFDYKVGNSSIFSANKRIEIMKTPFRGAKGHLAVGTADIDEAVAYLRRKGIAFAEETAVVKEGKLIAIYLQQEIAGFAVHLVQAAG